MNHCGKSLTLLFLCGMTFFQMPSFALELPPLAGYSDGIFSPSESITIDLSQAIDAAWDENSLGSGVFDAEQWAVVFKYTEVNIPNGVTIDFLNHETGAPVVWLVEGDVTIDGSITLNGARGHDGGTPTYATPGPGGFRGGRGSASASSGSAGFGPGGADVATNGSPKGSGGGYGSAGGVASVAPGQTGSNKPGGLSYGNPRIIPLIGGSGGAGTEAGSGGGAGGGAILIATGDSVLLNGEIQSNGGGAQVGGGDRGGGGSGGSIRIVCEGISGSSSGRLMANGGLGTPGFFGPSSNGGVGRIRVEANSINLIDQGNPPFRRGRPGEVANLWPNQDGGDWIISNMTLAGESIPVDASGEILNDSMADVILSAQTHGDPPYPLVIAAKNLPDATEEIDMTVKVVRAIGEDIGGSDEDPIQLVRTQPNDSSGMSIWEAELDLPEDFSAIQVQVRPSE